LKRLNLAYRLGILIVIAEILLAVAIIIAGYTFTRKVIFRNLVSRSEISTLHASELVTETVNQVYEAVDFVGKDVFENGDRDQIPKFIDAVLKLKPNLTAINVLEYDSLSESVNFNYFLINTGRGIFNEKDSLGHASIILEDFYRGLSLNGGKDWSDIFFIKDNKYPYIAYAKVFNTHGNAKGIVCCIISMEGAIKRIDNSMSEYESSFSMLISDRKTILYHSDHKLIGKKLTVIADCFPADFFNKINYSLGTDNAGMELISTNCLEKEKAVVVYWPVSIQKLTMLFVLPRSAVLKPLNSVIYLIIAFTVALLGLIITITLSLSKMVVSPISKLAKDTKKILAEEGEVVSKVKYEAALLAGGMEKLKERVETFQKKWIETARDKETIDKELQLARDIEKSLIPKFPLYPDRDEIDCYADLLPARTVGGDLFDIFLLDENRLLITICDTMGKGIPAAMFSVMTRTLIRNIAGRHDTVNEMVKHLNDELSGDGESGMFVTLFLGILNISTGELTFCNAGHTYPFIVSKNGIVRELSLSHGIPVGAIKDQEFGESKIILNAGDVIIGYTDGITEEHDEQDNLFGVDRLKKEIEENYMKSPKQFIKSVINAVKKFRGDREQRDDISMVSVRYNGNKTERN